MLNFQLDFYAAKRYGIYNTKRHCRKGDVDMMNRNLVNMASVSNCAQALSFEGFFSYAYFYFYYYSQAKQRGLTRQESR